MMSREAVPSAQRILPLRTAVLALVEGSGKGNSAERSCKEELSGGHCARGVNARLLWTGLMLVRVTVPEQTLDDEKGQQLALYYRKLLAKLHRKPHDGTIGSTGCNPFAPVAERKKFGCALGPRLATPRLQTARPALSWGNPPKAWRPSTL